MYIYSAKLIRVVDGDTVDLDVDLGFKVHQEIRTRLYGIDTPEIYGVKKESEEFQKGKAASNFVEEWFASLGTNNFIVETIKDQKGKYGRYLVRIWSLDKSKNLNEDLVASGHATEVFYD
jgi:micrococcal nuclease